MDVMTLSAMPPWEWPRDAGSILLHTLSDQGCDRVLRCRAAELAGEVVVIDDAIASALVEIVVDEEAPDDLRTAAALSLGPVLEELEYGLFDWEEEPVSSGVEKAVREALRQVYLDPAVPTAVRRRVLEASVRSEEAWHRGAVRAGYHSGDDEWRLTAVFCMYYVGGFREEIIEALDDDDHRIRREAVRAAGNWGLPEAWPVLLRMIREKEADRPLVLSAIDALVGIDPGSAHEALHELAEGEDDEVAEAALDALAEVDALEAGRGEPF